MGFTVLSFLLISQASPSSCYLSSSSSPFSSPSLKSSEYSLINLVSLLSTISDDEDEPKLSKSVMVPLPAHGIVRNNVSEEEREFWEQPDG